MASNQLTTEQLNEIREAFKIFDRDNSGKISIQEMKSVFKTLNVVASEKDVRNTIKSMDADHDGEISFEEFLAVMGSQCFQKYTMNQINEAFRYYDRDNSGYITVDELDEAFKKLGKNLTREELQEMFSSMDMDKSGSISFDEFSHLLTK